MSDLITSKIIGIPELAILVTGHLKRLDLVTCALVNHAWHEAIIPFLYHTVTFGGVYPARHTARLACAPCYYGLYKYSQYTRVLKIYSRGLGDIPCHWFHYINLAVLDLEITHAFGNLLWFLNLLELISNNPSILTLRLTSTNPFPDDELDLHLVMLRQLRYMPGLKKLVIVGISMGQSSVDEIMRCAYRLEELDLTMARIDKDRIPRPNLPLIGFDLESSIAELSLKDHDDVNTLVGPYIADSQGRQCRKGTSIKTFSLTLTSGRCKGYTASSDTFLLLRHCCSAENIKLSIVEKSTRGRVMQTLHDLVGQPACALKHLDLGRMMCKASSEVLLEILRASTSSLVSFRLRDSVLFDELISVLLQYHGKTLQRVTLDECKGVNIRGRARATVATVETVLSGCPNLKSLDIFQRKIDEDVRMALAGDPQEQWTAADGQVFEMLTFGQVPDRRWLRRWQLHLLLDTTLEDEDDRWDMWHVPLLHTGYFYDIRIRSIAN
ncbi:hypothetical protein BGZ68_008784 [Mortierella alpina]|nr:hypothetical protein BGZ68_008784 [Mortierella alpina]